MIRRRLEDEPAHGLLQKMYLIMNSLKICMYECAVSHLNGFRSQEVFALFLNGIAADVIKDNLSLSWQWLRRHIINLPMINCSHSEKFACCNFYSFLQTCGSLSLLA